MSGNSNACLRGLAAAMAGLMLLAGCTRGEIEYSETALDESVEFQASFEEVGPESRTFLDESMRLCWNADDRLSLFVGNTVNQQFSFQGKDGDRSGSFLKIQDGSFISGNGISNNVAVYPYSADTRMEDDGTLKITIPDTQEYSENSIGKGANMMVAVTQNTSDNFLTFKNLGGYLRFRLYGDAKISSAVLKGNVEEVLAGQASVTAAYGQDPVLKMENTTSHSITLNLGDGLQLPADEDDAVELWFALRPVTFVSGFTLTLFTPDGREMSLYTEGRVSVERNKVSSMSARPVFDDSFSARLKSLQLIPENFYEGLGLIEFTPFLAPEQDGLHSPADRFIECMPVTLTYKYTPENADVDFLEYVFEQKSDVDADSHYLEAYHYISNDYFDCMYCRNDSPGILTVNLGVKEFPSFYESGKIIDKFRLCAIGCFGQDLVIIRSDYANVSIVNPIEKYSLVHRDHLYSEADNLVTVRKYRTEVVGADEPSDSKLYPELSSPCLTFVNGWYDDLDLYGSVDLIAFHNDAPIRCFDYFLYDLKFELVGADGNKWNHETNPYIVDGVDQNMFVTLTEDGLMKVNPSIFNTEVFKLFSPLVKVTATTTSSEGITSELAHAFIKVTSVDHSFDCPPPPPAYHVVTNHHVDFCGDCLPSDFIYSDSHYNSDALTIDWVDFNQSVLMDVNMSYADFIENYDLSSLSVLEVDEDRWGRKDSLLIDARQYDFPMGVFYTYKFEEGIGSITTTDPFITLYLTNEVEAPSEGTIEFVLEPKNSFFLPKLGFRFSYTVSERSRPITSELPTPVMK